MLKINGLAKVYRTEQVETTAIQHVNLEIKAGEFVGIMGPSGCGKSTLLNILGLLDRPQRGTYEFEGVELLGLPEKQQSLFRAAHIGVIFQSFNLIDRLTVADNVGLPLLYAKTPAEERKQKVNDMLQRMNLSHRAQHFPPQLSGGQQQRVAVSRALINNPKLVLADEPTGNLDSANGNGVMELFCDLNDAGATIVMVTHSQHDASFCKRVIYMRDGQIVTQKINNVHSGSLL